MPQIFSRSANIYSKASIGIAGLVLVAVILIGGNVTPYTHRLRVALDQPAPFSHKHHVAELGIDCRYCHTTVEKSPFAGIPATETCYTCHSQIWTNSPLLLPVRESMATGAPIEWNRVANAPAFVYFDHSIHIAKGVSCYTCHGPVDEMNLTYKEFALEMLWCLDCHRNPEAFIRPKEEIYNPAYKVPKEHAALGRQLVEKYGIQKEQLSDCWVCHR
ncbi:MAG: cytochrome c3 family protein [Fimbriimonadales bacterium]|nr:cytochrome c3 family protein [Fimbriimonadales bacterium]